MTVVHRTSIITDKSAVGTVWGRSRADLDSSHTCQILSLNPGPPPGTFSGGVPLVFSSGRVTRKPPATLLNHGSKCVSSSLGQLIAAYHLRGKDCLLHPFSSPPSAVKLPPVCVSVSVWSLCCIGCLIITFPNLERQGTTYAT